MEIMIEASQIEQKLRENLKGVHHIDIEDLTGTKDHYKLTITAEAFIGLTRIQQHQAIYKALGDWMLGPIHALTITANAP